MEPSELVMKSRPQSRSWTNEMHVQFLKNMEASFVRTMFRNKDRRPLRLDRYLPDISDSTLDLKTHKTKNQNTTTTPGGRMDGGGYKRLRRLSSQPPSASQDQVVPQFEIRTAGDKDERDHHKVNVPALAPIN